MGLIKKGEKYDMADVLWIALPSLEKCCVAWAWWLLFERSLILMAFLRGFVMGPSDAWRALHHALHKHGDTQSGTCLLIDATLPFPSVLYVCVCVCVCVCVLHLALFVPVTHLISQTFDAECKRDTYWHIIWSEQCVLLQLITVSAFLCCAARFGEIAVAALIA